MKKVDVSILKKKLESLKDKGYIKVAFSVEGDHCLDILIIHRDWVEYSFTKHMDQCQKDLDTILEQHEQMYSLEFPTLQMYREERNPDAPIQEHVVFDLLPK